MADDPNQIDNEEIEKLLEQAKASASGTTPPPATPSTPATPTPPPEVAETPVIDQSEMDQLLTDNAVEQATATMPPPGAPVPSGTASNTVNDVQMLLNHAEEALASVDEPTQANAPEISTFELKDFSGTPANGEMATLELLRDVELDLKIELGRTYMHLEEVLKLRRGSVVALDKLAGDPVDVFANGRLIARGEILVLNDNFCVRVAELVSGDHA